jgi:hypothetical protein
MVQDNELFPDFPSGPLDLYRKQASFDWKKLKLFLEDESIIEFKVMFEPIVTFYFFSPSLPAYCLHSIRGQYDRYPPNSKHSARAPLCSTVR